MKAIDHFVENVSGKRPGLLVVSRHVLWKKRIGPPIVNMRRRTKRRPAAVSRTELNVASRLMRLRTERADTQGGWYELAVFEDGVFGP